MLLNRKLRQAAAEELALENDEAEYYVDENGIEWDEDDLNEAVEDLIIEALLEVVYVRKIRLQWR